MRGQAVPGSALSDRELEVLWLVAQGMTNPQIGKLLWIRPDTVKHHLSNIGKRLGCGERAGMVGIAYRTGLLRIPDAELMRQADGLVERVRQARLEALHDELVAGRGLAA